MRSFLSLLAAAAFAAVLLFPASHGQAAEKYLFEQNKAKFPEIQKVTSRSFKYLVKFDANADMEKAIMTFRNQIVRAGEAKGYEFREPKKGTSWKYADKVYYDTANYDIYKKGYVIRENYPHDKGEKADPDNFVLTVKEMSPSDFNRLAKSTLKPAPGSSAKIKFEENVSIDAKGQLQSYFESTVGSDTKGVDLGKRTLGDYAKLYPDFAKLGLPLDVPLQRYVGYSTQFKMGQFRFPDKTKMKMAIEGWSRTPGGKPILISVDMDIDDDDHGYATSTKTLQECEDFFNEVFVQGLKGQYMPGGEAYMGSKVRVLIDQKN